MGTSAGLGHSILGEHGDGLEVLLCVDLALRLPSRYASDAC